MNKKIIGLVSLTSLAFSLFAFSSAKESNKIVETLAVYSPSTTYTNHDADTYYSSVSSDLVGDALLAKLRGINSSRRKKTVGYGSMGTSAGSSAYAYTDYTTDTVKYDSNGQPYGASISSFYTFTKTANFNREHVWPNTHGGNKVENDIHMTRPTISAENGDRGHSFYVEGMDTSTSGWDPKTAGYNENSRGEAARIIFYCVVASDQLSLAVGNSLSNQTSNTVMGDLVTLMKWNVDYPVTERERNRNEGAEYLQGNRNPFIDHPSYACRIWGELFKNNNEIASICARANFDEEYIAPVATPNLDFYKVNNNTETKISTASLDLAVGDSVSLVGYVNGVKSDKVAWTLDGDSVVETWYGTNGRTYTAVEEGETTIKLSSNYKDNDVTKTVTKQLKINVTNGTGGGGNIGPVTDDNLTLITTSNFSSLCDGDHVVLKSDSGKGVTGNGDGNATISSTMSDWTEYIVHKDSDTVTLQNSKTKEYIETVTKNNYSEGSKGGKITGTDDGILKVGDRFLCINGKNIRLYTICQSTYEAIRIYKVGTTQGEDTKTLVSLRYTGTCKTTYDIDDQFDSTGINVIAKYSDDSEEDVTTSVIWTANTSVAGNSVVVGTYTEDGVSKTVQIQITINGQPPVPPIVIDDDDDGDDTGGETEEDLDPVITGDIAGCEGSVVASSLIIPTLSLAGLALIYRKKKEN